MNLYCFALFSLTACISYHPNFELSTVFLIILKIYLIYSIAKLNSTPLWNLILQITQLSNVEFNSSYFYFIILYINMALPPSIKEALMNKHTH